MRCRRCRPLAVACLVFAFNTLLHAATPPLPQTIDFNRDIRPILSENCYFCHGPDKNKRKADLRLDTHDGLFSHIKNHTTVVPGHPEQSELFRRVTLSDPDERMPDPKSNKRLSDRQIALLKKWIEQGAPWKGHWAYLPLARPEPPAINDPGFVHNEIDRFILAGLKDAALKHAPEADRVTLIRRLSFDLTGLPPKEADVQAFVNDTSLDAYDKLVDRLLSSPQFGERMAVWWLDLVRYADTIGYHSDNPMNVWPYRDYVINAFNANKPFDQFTREQLAGDLLPNSTQEQKVASAYNRLIETTEEGGAQAKEYAVKYECDRVRNISTVWLAATMGCSQCHDHKFDPYTQKDFYSMAAFFADVQEAAIGRREPGMLVLNDAQAAELKKLDSRVTDLKKQLDTDTPELADAQAAWEKSISSDAPVEWTTLEPSAAKAKSGTELKILPDRSILGSKFAAKDTFSVTASADLKGVTGVRLEVLPDSSLPATGPGGAPNGNFVLTGFNVSVKGGAPVKLMRASADHSQDRYPIASALLGKAKSGWAILPETGKAHEAIFEPAEPFSIGDAGTLTFRLQFQSQFAQHEIGHFRLSLTTAPNPAGRMGIPEKVRSVLAIDPVKRSDSQRKELAAYYRTIASALQPLREELAKAEKAKADFEAAAPKCLVSVSGPPRVTRLLHRGNWQDDSGEIESPAVPHFLPHSTVHKERLSRLDLADWLMSPQNPLPARVVVNRLWKMYMGVGISKTVDDLGSQGESPTNPELLDWLASEFVRSGWDMKHVVRLIVTSGTYRQSSLATPQDMQVDPFNRLYAHQSRFRLDAEMVRDNALEVSGLLSLKMGGPSVKPYQPAGYWDALNFPTRTYEADKGENQYRRGLYTWWQRTFVHPSLLAFDAPTREEATCERTQSNIPQQALVLLDDPTYVEAARVFAARILREGGSTTADRLNFAYETALNRPPRPKEAKILCGLFEKHLQEYTQDKESARKLVATGDSQVPKDLDVSELAAWTSVSRVILNLSETITRS
jgi:hypothetical protein